MGDVNRIEYMSTWGKKRREMIKLNHARNKGHLKLQEKKLYRKS